MAGQLHMLTRTNAAFAAVIGGWVTVMTPAVLTIALRTSEFEKEGLPNTLPVTLFAGWLTLMLALVVTGRLSDRLLERTGSRITLIRIGAPLLILTSIGLALSPSGIWLTTAWVLAQIPAAMIITTALAVGGGFARVRQRGLVSGLLGAAPIVGLLIGSVVVGILPANTSLTFIVTAVLGGLLTIPLMLTDLTQPTIDEAKAPRDLVVGHARILLWVWVLFLCASFLLSWTTSTTNTFIVEYISESIRDTDSTITTIASISVGIASLAAILSSIIFGTLARNPQRARYTWIVGALIATTSILLLASAETAITIYIAALLFGIGFGAANGVEVSITLHVRPHVDELGQDLGILNSVTSAPYILVPAMTALVWQSDDSYTVGPLLWLSAATALLGAVVFASAKLLRTG